VCIPTGRHIPHIMTLFDRKVDLARFTLDTPLYIMCREWMWNNPSAHAQNKVQASNADLDQVNQLESPTPMERDLENGEWVRLEVPAVAKQHQKKIRLELDEHLKVSGRRSCREFNVRIELILPRNGISSSFKCKLVL